MIKNTTVFIIFLFAASSIYAQYKFPVHNYGYCYNNSGGHKPGTADMEQVYIYNENLQLVYHRKMENSSCTGADSSDFYTYDNVSGNCVLSSGTVYTLVVEFGNGPGFRKFAGAALWLDADRDSSFEVSEYFTTRQSYMATEWSNTIRFTIPPNVSNGNSRLRLRTAGGPPGSLDANSSLDFGETLDIEVALYTPANFYVRFLAPDTACIGANIDFININHDSGLSHSWYLNGVFQANTRNFQYAGFTKGSVEVKLITRDSLGSPDSFSKTIHLTDAQNPAIPLFTTDKERVQLYDYFFLKDFSPHFSTARRWMMIDGADTILSQVSKNNANIDPQVLTGLGGPPIPGPGSWDVCLMAYNNTNTDSSWKCMKDYVQISGDHAPPIAELIGPDTVMHTTGTQYISMGAFAYDLIAGDVSTILAVWTNIDPNVVGCYKEVWIAWDTSGNQSDSVVRVICVVPDDVPPLINLIGSDTVFVQVFTAYTEDSASAWDNLQGDLTDSIYYYGSVDTHQLGEYLLSYVVRDNFGNADTAYRLVIVGDTIPPEIRAKTLDTVQLQLNESYLVQNYVLMTDNWADSALLIQNHVVIYSNVDPANAGMYYTRLYTVDQSGNISDTFTLYVNVMDETGTVLTGQATELHIYPNPAFDFVIVDMGSSMDGDQSVSLYDHNGKIILPETCVQGSLFTLDLHSYARGLYFVKIRKGEEIKILPIFKL